jgi:hypothetical protein
MTLIAAYSHATSSFLIADTMISSRLPNLAAVTLPVSGRTYEPYTPLGGAQEYYVSTVTQKVHLISDHLAIAWAGSRVVGESMIRSVMQKLERRQVRYRSNHGYRGRNIR